MPKTKLDHHRPNPKAVAKLIKRYIKIERDGTVEGIIPQTGISRTRYYSRMRMPGMLTLDELHLLAKTLRIPADELNAAVAEALQY